MNIDTNCYKFHKINFNNSLFNDTIDVTYIIHLENNGRLQHIIEQLNEYHITNTVYIVFNKGCKKCIKYNENKKIIDKPANDLTYSYIKIFEHANENNYNNILILEDDFIFNPKIKDVTNIQNIKDFLIKFENEKFIYSFGCIPVIQIPYDLNNYYLHSFGLSHSIIYSKESYNEILKDYYINNNKNKLDFHFDLYLSLKFRKFKAFIYKEPLCYQTLPETENSKNWSNMYSEFIIHLLNIDKNPEPGFTIIYTYCRYISILIINILLFLKIYLTKNLTINQKFISIYLFIIYYIPIITIFYLILNSIKSNKYLLNFVLTIIYAIIIISILIFLICAYYYEINLWELYSIL